MTGLPIEQLSEVFLEAFLVFSRAAGFVGLMPGFGDNFVPMRIRLVAAIAISMACYPYAVDQVILGGPMDTIGNILIETLLGLTLGLSIRLMVLGLQTAGVMIAQSTSLSQLLGTPSVEPMPSISYLLVIGATVLAFIAELPIKAVMFIISSYTWLPYGQVPAMSDLAEWFTQHVQDVFAMAFSLAGPFVVIALLYNIALGAINRAMPQLMVAFVGAPLITLLGLAMFAILAPTLLAAWLESLNLFLSSPTESFR